MAEKKSWRDYYSDNSGTDTKADDKEKKRSWRDYYNAEYVVGNNVSSQLNSLLTDYNNYVSDYQKRFANRKGTYDDAYVTDSGDWLNSTQERQADLDQRATAILSYLNEYGGHLDAKTANEIRNTIDAIRNNQNQILDFSKKDNEFWNSFGSEDLVKEYGSAEEAYKYYQRADGYNKKYEGLSSEDLQWATNFLEDGEEKEWVNSYASTVDYNERANLDLDAAQKEFDDLKTTFLRFRELEWRAVTDEEKAELEQLRQQYNSSEELWNTINKRSDYIDSAKEIQKWNSYAQMPGFYSAVDEGKKIPNVVNYSRENYNKIMSDVADRVNTEGNPLYIHMSQDEVDTYSAILATEGEQTANAYLQFLMPQLESREVSRIAGRASELPVLGSLYSVGTSTLGSAAEYLVGLGKYATDKLFSGKKVRLDSNYNAEVTNAIRGAVSDKVDWKIGNWDAFDFVYNTAMSGIDSAAAMALGGAGGVVLGLSAAAQGTNDALNRGMNSTQAFWGGLASGVFEGLFESLSIGNFKALKETAIDIPLKGLDKNVIKTIAKNLGKTMLTNASEEAATEIANIMYDTLVNGEFANYTLEELMNGAWKDAALQVAEAAGSGALMGFGFGAVGNTSAVRNSTLNKYGAYTGEMIQQGLKNDPKSKSYKLAQKYEKKTSKDRNLTAHEIRSLLAANNSEITKSDMQKIQSAAEKRLTSLGQTEDVQKVAELASKYATGGKLTRAETSFLANSKYGSRVANELLPENIASGDYSTEWAENIGTKQVNFGAYNIRAIVDEMLNKGQYKSLESRMEADTPAKVSDTGKAVISGTNEEIDLAKPTFKQITDEGVVLLVNGKDVRSDNIDYESEDQALAINAIGKIEHITPEAAGALYDKVDMTKDVMPQLNGIDEAFTYGYYNYSEADLEAGLFTGNLTKDQLNDAYNLGRNIRKNDIDAKADAFKAMRTAADAIAEKNAAEGKEAPGAKNLTITYKNVKGEAISFDEENLSPRQSGGVEWAKILHKMGIGTRVEFFESYESETMTVKDKKTGKVKKARVFINDAGVEQIAYSGVYRKSDGTIRIDLNAYNGRGFTLNALAHELTHFIQQWSDKKYKVLVDFLMKEYEKTDMTMHERVLREQKRLQDIRGEEVSYDEAYDEVVANAMNKMFDDGKMAEKLAKLKEQDKNLAQKLWEGFKEILAKFMGLYKNEGLFWDADVLDEMKETFDQLQNMFAEALVEASENYQASLTVSESQTLAEAGISFDEDTKSVYSLHFSTAYKDEIQVGKKTFDTEAIAKIVAKGTGRSIEDARKWVQSELTIANIVMANPEFLDFEADNRYEAIKKNSDYPQGTVDLSNLCPKREEFTTMFDMLQKKYPNKLFTAQDVAEMRKILSDNDITVACGACFVEDRRQLLGEIADTYINMWKEAVETGKPLQKTNAAGVKSDLLVTKALAKQYGLTAGTKIMATDTYIPNQYDLTTYEGFKLLEKNHPTIAMGFNRYNNSRGQQSARLIEGRAEYKRQILGWSDAKVRSVNNNGGLRIFSFSDFEVVHLLDLVQVIIDCAAKGVKIQGYTKIPAFAKLVRDTGIKLNRSLIPKGDYGYHMENGKVVLDYDTTEGINYEDENFIDESNNPNVGNIVIGINPTQIGAAMLDPFIDYIIPFHSNKAKEILRKLGTGEWVNYKESQHEKDIATGTSSKHNVNIYTEVINKYHPTNKVEFVEAFLKECKRQGKIPRYAEFLNVDANGDYAYREGYHKLLVDFKMFDAEGNILPQGNITPSLNENFMKELLNAEIDKKQNYEFPQKVYDDIDKKFGENILDNSSVGNENSLTENKARGEVNDIRGVRKGTEEATGVSETDGRGYSEYVGASQEVKSWDRLSNLARRQIVGIVDSHIKASKSQYEVFALISGIANISKEGLTTAQKTNAIHKVTEQIYSDAITMPSLLFEDKWRILGKANELRREIIAATKTKPSDGEKNLDSDGRQITKGQQQFFKDTKVVDKNGRLLVMYHGSSSNIRFTVFELRSMVNGRIYGEGYYFTEDKNEALNWGGGQLYEVYVNLSNPYYASTKMEAPEAIVALAKENYGRTYDRLSQDPNWWGSKYTREEYIEQNSRMWSNSDLALESAIDTSDIPEKGFSEELARRKTELLRSLHYDGVIVTTSKSNRNFHEVVAFDPEQIKLTTNKNPTKNIDMQYSSQETDADNAPVFYSQMAKVVEGMKQEKFGASSVISMLRGRGVKAEEIRWSGIQAFLDGKKSVTKAELLEFIKGSMLRIQETVLDGTGERAKLPGNYRLEETETEMGDPMLNLYIDGGLVDTFELMADDSIQSTGDSGIWAMDEADLTGQILNYYAGVSYDDAYGVPKETKWDAHRLAGGTNYREMLFKMPGAYYSNGAMEAHWGNRGQGVLAHARMQDFDVNGKKMLFVEEIQSDWHNAGHKIGYVDKDIKNELAHLESAQFRTARERVDMYRDLLNDLTEFYRQYGLDTPEAAAENHLDLSLSYANQSVLINGFNQIYGFPEGLQSRLDRYFELEKKENDIVKQMRDAKRGVPDAPFRDNYHEFVLKRLLRMAAEEGYDSIGWTTADIQSQRWSDEYAEGYRIEYDQDIPKFLKKYGKQWGAEVGKSEITTGKLTDWEADMIEKGIIEVELPTSSVWSMAITPSMKKSVLEEGQALYSEHDTDYSNRSLLANAFEGITKDSIEYKMIQEYKGHIGVLNMLDKRLSVLNDQIRDIRFTKGKYDAEKLRELESEREEVIGEINRYDKMLLNLEASEPLRKVILRERQKEAQKTKEHVKKIQQNKKVRAEQTELRHKIRKAIRDLDKILNRGNKKVNVKDDLQPVVTKALQAAEILFTDNYGNYDMLRNGIGADLSDAEEALVETCAKMLKDLDKMPSDGYENFQARQEAENRLKTKMSKLNEVFARERKRLNNTKVSSILGELADAYKSLETSDQSYVQGSYSEPVYNFLKNLQSEVGGTIVKDMSKDQLENVYAAYRMVLTTVRKANQMFNEELKQTREQLGNAVIQEVLNAGGVHLLGTKLGDAISQFDWNNMKPIWLENRVGSETFGKLVNGLFKGQYNFAVDIDGAKQFKLEMDKKYKPRNWDAEKQYKFQSSTGKEFSLNLQQIMSLYAFSKREQAYSHLLNGGFVFEDNSTVVVDGKLGIKKTYIHKGAASYKLNEATLNSIINSLTKEQKAYVDEMQKYLSDVMGAKGNEVSMQLYGIKMFNEQFYFPLRSSGAYMERAKEAELKKQQGQINLVNSGFTHSVKPEAKNPIILSGFMDVWAEHCNEMSMYHSMVLPMEDFRKVYNYSTIHDEKMESASVYQTIQDAYGKAATNYIDQLYRELNAGATVDPREAPFKRLISNFKKAAVMLSGSVVVQQFSSIGRAYDIIDPKYFTGAKVNSGTNLSVADEMKKYAPVAIIKEMGGFDTGTKGSAKSYIMAEQYGKGERVKGLLKDEQYRGDIMGYLPAKADELTWSAIWEAVKRETKSKNPKMDVKSEEFLKLAGERFSEVIEKTQVYDSVLARSANMRSKGNFMAMATAFMAEPTTTINLLEDAIRSGKAKNIARAFGSVAVSIVLNNALASIVYAMRDDDDDETFLEKYFQAFTSGMIDDINPMSYYPFLKDVYSLFQGYDVERADMSVIADVRDALKRVVSLLGKDTSGMDDDELAEYYKQVNEVFMGLLDAGCSMFGVPVKNVRRDALAIVNGIKTIGTDFSDERDNSWLSFWDKVGAAAKDTIPIYAWTKDKSKNDKLYDAIISGDKKYLARLKSTYKTDSAYQGAVRKALRENDSRIQAAAQARYDGNTEEYKRIFREIQKEGNFSFDDIMSAINSEESAIKGKLEPDKATSNYGAGDFVDAVIVGNTSSAKAIRDDIIATHIANGKTQKEAEEAFASSVKASINDAYSSGLLDDTGAKNMLIEYADMDEEDATSRVSYWAFCNDNPKYAKDVSEAKYNKYKEFAEPAGIDLDAFVQYIKGTKGLETIKDEWGDVVKSEREQVLDVIDSLPLTWQQKDALYLAYGYAESKIWDVPW